MTKAELLKKHREGNYLLNDDFEADLDEVLRDHTIKFMKDEDRRNNEVLSDSFYEEVYKKWNTRN